jgi:hypothetical protein
MFDFLKIKATIASLAGELEKLRSEREALLRKREDLEGAPACKEDLLATLDIWIARKASDFPKKLETGTSYYRRHPLTHLPEDVKVAANPLAVLTAVTDPNGMATLQTLESSLCFVLRDSIRGGIHEAVEQLDFSTAGPPRAERLETIKAIDARIDAIDKLEQSLTDEAEKAGLKI